MKIVSAEFVKGVTGTSDILNDGKFQVAFMGRSNVGKSSLINSLTMKNGLARSSATPGKTIRMDFFLINKKFYFVDFPGYGYARHSQEKREKLAKMMVWYLTESGLTKRLVLLIIDAAVGFTKDDREMLAMIREQKINYLVVANKIDKVKMGQERSLGAFPYSAKKKSGRTELLAKIAEDVA